MTCKGWRSKYDVEDETRSPEVNGNSYLGKRKRSRAKKHGYLQEWFDKSWTFLHSERTYGYEDEPGFRSAQCWQPSHPTVPVVDRRLYPTVSEPAMCRYSVPVGYSLEPISLPVYAAYVPMSSEPVPSSRRRGRPVVRSAPPPTQANWQVRKDSRRIPTRLQPTADTEVNEEFTSLPPAASSHTPDTVRRRFSDPGIGRPSGSLDGCCSTDSSESREDSCSTPEPPVAESNSLVMSLMEQVNAQQDSIKQLYSQLQETKAELETLKQSWQRHPSDYQPGMLTDLIRDIRDATKVREEAIISTVRNMLEGTTTTNHVMAMKDGVVTSQKLDQIVQQLQCLQVHRDKTRCSNNEADCSTAKLHDAQKHTEEVCALELENVQLRRSLQESVARSKEKEAQARQLELLVDVLKRKSNGVAVEEKPVSSEQSPSESLVSTVSSSSSNHSPQVTMSGPVTDL